jgi:hypothetical protein
MMSIIAASEVDLPDPVGPVTSTNPRGFRVNSSRICGNPSSPSWGISWGIRRKAALIEPRWKKQLTRKRETPGTAYARSSCLFDSKRLRWSSLSML